jgi:hypothetical protein
MLLANIIYCILNKHYSIYETDGDVDMLMTRLNKSAAVRAPSSILAQCEQNNGQQQQEGSCVCGGVLQ